MRSSGTGSGGGLGNNKVVRPNVRTGTAARAQNPRGVSQIGQSLGNHSTGDAKKLTKSAEPVRGAAMPKFSVPLGNETARTAGQGPGAGRVTSKSGSQGVHGPVNPGNPPPAGELFPGWGPKR
jgi:hypothetical protein